MKIYLATWLEEKGTQGATLTKVAAKKRLLSYYLVNTFLTYKQFSIYAKTGSVNLKKKKQ